MSKDVAERYELLKLSEAGNINIKELSEILNVSKQQTYKIIRRYKEEGIRSLYHGNTSSFL